MTKAELLRKLEPFSGEIEIFVTTSESPNYYEVVDAQWEHQQRVRRVKGKGGEIPAGAGPAAIIMLNAE